MLKTIDPVGLQDAEVSSGGASGSSDDDQGENCGGEGSSSVVANGESEPAPDDPCGEGACVLRDEAFEEQQRAEVREQWRDLHNERARCSGEFPSHP